MSARFIHLRSHQSGWTLLESLFCVTLALTLLTFTGSAFTGAVQTTRRQTRINELITSLQLARNQAILSGTPVVMCKSLDGYDCHPNAEWHQGWLIFTDFDGDEACNSTDGFVCVDGGAILFRRNPSTENTLKIVANRAEKPIRFGANGFSEGSNRSFFVCETHQRKSAEQIILSRTGRVRRQSTPAPTLCNTATNAE